MSAAPWPQVANPNAVYRVPRATEITPGTPPRPRRTPSVAPCHTSSNQPSCFGLVEHMVGRLRWALATARHAKPETRAARLRLLWHDFVIHGLLHRGGERCQDCGRDYPAWHADDMDWRRVMGGPSGLLCAACFGVRRAA